MSISWPMLTRLRSPPDTPLRLCPPASGAAASQHGPCCRVFQPHGSLHEQSFVHTMKDHHAFGSQPCQQHIVHTSSDHSVMGHFQTQ